MNTEMIFSMNEAVAVSSRVRGQVSQCAITLGWHHATIAAPTKYATKRNPSALEELRTE
ncbi:MAG: hypothetical protein GX868_04125 [Actinobacteria bacterium]|nr:hypothetical protein [Actinomycetota bacterium]